MESVSSISSEIVNLTRSSVKLLKKKSEILRHVSIIRVNIRLLEKAIANKIHFNNAIESPIRLENNLGLLKFYLAKLQQQLKNVSVKKGCGIDDDDGDDVNKKQPPTVRWYTLDSCFNDRLLTGMIVNFNHKDPMIFLKHAYDSFARKINVALKRSMLKVNTTLICNFIHPQTLNIDLKTFQTRNAVIDIGTNLKEYYKDKVFDNLQAKLENFSEQNSGWSLLEVLHLKVNINSYVPIKGGFSTYIKVPPFISVKRAVINVRNNDKFCLLWSIVAALYPAHKNADRVNNYPHFDEVLNRGSIQFPIKLTDIKKIEQLNDLAINLYCVVKRNVLPFMVSDRVNSRKTINLLVLSSKYNDTDRVSNSSNVFYHFAWIKNMSALLSSQLSHRGHKKFFCNICLNHFSSNSVLEKHTSKCHQVNKCSIRLPNDDQKYLQFTHYSYMEKVPFTIYADLESILEKCDNLNPQDNNTALYQKHTPFSVAFYLKCSYDESLSKFLSYRGADCIPWFIKQLRDIADWTNVIVNTIVPMEVLSPSQIQNFDNAVSCHICKKPFTENQIKVRDHFHLNGAYRGPAHQACNLNYNDSHVIPVVFHNLSGYDSHFFIRELATAIPGEIKLLPLNKEKYISFSKYVKDTSINFRFIDSFRFLSTSIDKLSSYLENDKKTLTRLHTSNANEFRLLMRKGVLPYDYLDSWERLHETVLPPRDAFFNHLKNEAVSEADYQHAVNVWNTFEIKTLGQYSDLYLKTDVLLLADIFENFRETCLQTYQLDPLHYYTAPGLAFDAMLKVTDVKLELLTDIDQAMFIEKGIRGGVAQCSTRYAKANNPYMKEKYNPNLETNYLMYLDLNSLYGAAMCNFLPYGEFSFVDDIENIDILNHPDDSDVGYILECDFDYPNELHDSHSDLPLAPEHMVPPGSKLTKLMLTLYSKRNYVIHYRNLKMYIQHGLKLVKIHRVLRFKQSPWLRKYIELNTSMRQQAKNEFDKNFYKLMINSVFGKLMENVRKYKDVHLLTEWGGRYGARNYISKPNFHSSMIFDKDMVIVEMNRLEIFFNKPIYAGFAVLDISKTFLYDFHYSYILQKFQNKARLLYTDTDSLIYSFTVPNIYETIKEDVHRFDTSDYDVDNEFGIPLVNKKIPGLMKDENRGRIMTEFVGLRAKMYAYEVDEKLTKKSKGSTLSSIREITINDYKNALFNILSIKREQNLIRSKKHTVFTLKQNKVVLNPHDDKRIICHNQIDTRPWGYNFTYQT
ncbi:hypothetical protein RI129_003764 [Pyrocoelia pectoralis]|uniref:C2H2-type domain-containing protein n=1 Tax=Pyrocoelia pectoralis TaxID=417401 RepID=A0AAN7ZNT2_9COLE